MSHQGSNSVNPTNGSLSTPVDAGSVGGRPIGLRSFVSLLGGRIEYASQTGLSHLVTDTANINYKRDLYNALGLPRTITFEMMYDEYKRGDIAERVVEAKPSATWSSKLEVTDDTTATEPTPWCTANKELWQRLDLSGVLYQADVLANIGHYSIILLGLPGNLSQARRSAKPDQLKYAVAYSEAQATIKAIDESPTSPRYGLPLCYDIHNGEEPILPALTDVHWSRVIHVCEGNLTDRVYGKPILRSIYNKLMALFKIVDGGAEAAWNRMDPGMVFNMDPELAPTDAELTAFRDEVEDRRNKLKRDLLLRGIEAKAIEAPVAGFSSNGEFVIAVISAATGVPKRILMGSEQGQQAGDSDRHNWNGLIDTRKDRFATPLILTIENRLIDLGVLPKPKGPLAVKYPPVQTLSPYEIAEVLAKVATANQGQQQAEGTVVMSAAEMRVRFLDLGAEVQGKIERPPETVPVNSEPAAGNNDDDDDDDDDSDQPLDGRILKD